MIVLGRVVAPHGVTGWLRVHPFGDDPLSWRAMPAWWLGEEPNWQRRQLVTCKMQGSTLLVRFEGIDDRDSASALVGAYVAAPREELPETSVGEYYWGDLIGLAVVNMDGILLGSVEGLIETGANAVLQVRSGDLQRLLPFIESVVRTVDRPGARILVDWQPDW